MIPITTSNSTRVKPLRLRLNLAFLLASQCNPNRARGGDLTRSPRPRQCDGESALPHEEAGRRFRAARLGLDLHLGASDAEIAETMDVGVLMGGTLAIKSVRHAFNVMDGIKKGTK